MKKLRIIDNMFKIYPFRYLGQCLIATLSIMIILLFMDMLSQTAIIATLGATSFIIFILPHSYFAKFKPLFGGYLVGILVGCLFSLFAESSTLNDHYYYLAPSSIKVISGSLAVGLSIFLMAIFNLEHPPAAGIALSLVLNSWEIETILFIIIAVLALYAIKLFLGKIIIDLL